MKTETRVRILGKIQNQKFKNITNDIYRRNARIGDGSSMSAYRYEMLTGELVGGLSHAIKLVNYRVALERVLETRNNLNNFDRRIASEILADIIRALHGN